MLSGRRDSLFSKWCKPVFSEWDKPILSKGGRTAVFSRWSRAVFSRWSGSILSKWRDTALPLSGTRTTCKPIFSWRGTVLSRRGPVFPWRISLFSGSRTQFSRRKFILLSSWSAILSRRPISVLSNRFPLLSAGLSGSFSISILLQWVSILSSWVSSPLTRRGKPQVSWQEGSSFPRPASVLVRGTRPTGDLTGKGKFPKRGGGIRSSSLP